MEIILNLIVLYIGAIFGNLYYNLKEYILRKDLEKKETKKIKKETNCNLKGGFLGNIPFVSYSFNKGECKKCKKDHAKLKLISELVIGMVFVLVFNSANLTQIFLNKSTQIDKMEILLKGGLMFTLPLTLGFIYLLGTIERETKTLNVNVMTYGVIMAAALIIIKFIVNIPNVKYSKLEMTTAGIYMLIVLLIYLMQLLTFSKDPESKYTVDIVLMVFILNIYFGSANTISTIILSIIYILMGNIFGWFRNKEYKENIYVKKENGKFKTRKEGSFVTEYRYIPFSLIIGSMGIVSLVVNNFVATLGVIA